MMYVLCGRSLITSPLNPCQGLRVLGPASLAPLTSSITLGSICPNLRELTITASQRCDRMDLEVRESRLDAVQVLELFGSLPKL